MPGYFGQPKGLAVDSQDHLYVVDANFEAVQIFDHDGSLLMDFGRRHRPGRVLAAGRDLHRPHNRIWVADSYNRRVQVFDYLREKSREIRTAVRALVLLLSLIVLLTITC